VPELICTNPERSLHFYRDILGFQILYARPEERFVYLERPGAALMLEEPIAKDRLWPKAGLAYPFGRGINLEIRVEDVGLVYASAVARRLEIHLPLEEKWYRRAVDEICVRQFAVYDPDGYLVRPSEVVCVRPLRS
jgi:catechol 2,3-dioxygenase-like lactoylglutathione lyase family enzyme